MPSGGSNRKTAAALKLHGNYREDRHGSRTNPPKPSGELVKPTDLDDVASKAWDRIVEAFAASEMLSSVDGEILTQAVESYARWKAVNELAKEDPTSSAIRSAFEVYAKQFRAASALIGLSPVDRERLNLRTGEKTKTIAEKYGRKRG